MEWTIESYSIRVSRRRPWVNLNIRATDNTRGVTSFPLESLEWRAAEYDIDPSNIPELLDIILHEFYIPNPEDPRNQANDAALKKGFVSRSVVERNGDAVGDLVPTTLENAENIADAKAAHKLRIAEAKKNKHHVKFAPGDVVVQKLTADFSEFLIPDAVEAKKKHVKEYREKYKRRLSDPRRMMSVVSRERRNPDAVIGKIRKGMSNGV